MLTYKSLREHARELLAATGLTVEEFEGLLPAFVTAYVQCYPLHLTAEGKERRRQRGGGTPGILDQDEDRLLFILVYLKTNPLQTMHGLQFGMSQPQANYWIHRLLPVVQVALTALGMAPERDGSAVATSEMALAGALDLAIDGTERRRERPQDAEQQKELYSGKKKTHTDKNIVLVNESSGQVVYLGPTEAGSKHDKKAADEAHIEYPANATLDKDTGFRPPNSWGATSRRLPMPKRHWSLILVKFEGCTAPLRPPTTNWAITKRHCSSPGSSSKSNNRIGSPLSPRR